MSTAEMTERTSETPPRLKANFVGVYYLLTVLTGAFILLFHGRFALTADLIVSALYLNMTALLYAFSRPGNSRSGR